MEARQADVLVTRQDQISLFLWCAGAFTVFLIVAVAIGRDVWRYTTLMNDREDLIDKEAEL